MNAPHTSHTIRAVRDLVVVSAILGCLACDRPPEPEPVRETAPQKPVITMTSSVAAAKSSAPAAAASITWTDPPTWKRIEPTNPMRKATYRIPRAKGDSEDGELGVFQFGAQGGSVEANVERWVKQFPGVDKKAVERSERSVNGMRVHLVEIKSGTYQSGMPGGPTQPKEKFAMLGAIVEAPGGSWFFKLTGPKATVAEARPHLFALVDSIKKP